ncbi:hypothetical protein [Subtercola lobariae]|uniref:Uncharacterized protein n=1 Tax=Subtercola lobariae TaxID=1588641 RepID=A0A917B8P5_9MICO|nr:hypothetical protein [Subtercola lobariae]GGF29084.1 hypothetical protein GCM10011399_22750 [Subtercola lobariae]
MTIDTLTLLSSPGPLLFAPGDLGGGSAGGAVLFVADVSAATVFAFELPAETGGTGETAETAEAHEAGETASAGAAGDSSATATETAGAPDVRVDNLDAKLAALLGVERDGVVIRGLAVHPASRDVYVSVARGRGAEAGPALVRVDADGDLSVVELAGLPVTSFTLDDAPAADDERKDVWLDGSDEGSTTREIHGVELIMAQVPAARSTITDLAWVDGALYIAGMSNEEFTSRLRRVEYPFGASGSAQATSVEIFHVDHGQYETRSPIRALTSFDGGAGILATYTCTPVVHFSVAELNGGGLVRGRTVAELGPMNQPFSLVSYDRDGEEFLLVSNTRHPLLKIPAASIAGQAGLTQPLSEEGAPLGVPRESLDHPGVTWMANLDRSTIVVVQNDGEALHLRTLAAAVL